jgi:nucleotide-binding universal stress UspA family protein
MKKILLAFDDGHFSIGAFEFARQLNDLRPILLIGVFIPQLSYANLWSYATGIPGNMPMPLLEEEDSEAIYKNIDQFKELCIKNSIAFKVHKDFNDMALTELKNETRFADLLIIGSDKFYKGILNEDANDYLKDVLHTSECPVIIVPGNFRFPAVNVLTYDGSASSVYAIRQFAYLFPELCNQETVIVFMGDDVDEEIPCKDRIEELVHQHFMDVDIVMLDLSLKRTFCTWVENKKNAILISGSFGRTFISEFFRKSFLSDIIEEQKLPVFIAHK